MEQIDRKKNTLLKHLTFKNSDGALYEYGQILQFIISTQELSSEILQEHKFNCKFVLAACKWELAPNDNHDWGKRRTHSGETRSNLP